MKIKLGLDNINYLLDSLGRPELLFPSIHVAGTNGKGSTCAMLESIYKSAGLKTGLYTSPHLFDVRERIRINGEQVSLTVFKKNLERLLPTIHKHGCSFFEIVTATAFSHFREEKVDVAIVETGLGGRLDATNVLIPKMSIITEIDIDHVKQLGNTALKIAGEKAGIIKENVPVLSSASKPEVIAFFESICKQKNCKFISTVRDSKIENCFSSNNGTVFDLTTQKNSWLNLKLSLLGNYQVQNSVASICAFEELGKNGLPFNKHSVYQGLQHVNWQGRLHVLQRNPTAIVDVAHNNQGIGNSISQIARLFDYKKLICVFGVLADKDTEEIIRILDQFVDFYVTVTPNDERALHAGLLADRLKNLNKPVLVGQSITDGYQKALQTAEQNDLVCVLGSHFVAGEVLKAHKKT